MSILMGRPGCDPRLAERLPPEHDDEGEQHRHQDLVEWPDDREQAKQDPPADRSGDPLVAEQQSACRDRHPQQREQALHGWPIFVQTNRGFTLALTYPPTLSA